MVCYLVIIKVKKEPEYWNDRGQSRRALKANNKEMVIGVGKVMDISKKGKARWRKSENVAT